MSFDEFWQKYWLLIVVLICALSFDTLSTIHFMTTEGINFEAHPLVRYSALLFGPIAGTILTAFVFKIIAGLFLAMYLRNMGVFVLAASAITSTIAGVINLQGGIYF